MSAAEEIPIEKLLPNPRPIRSELKLTREFVADIRKEGVRIPLIVRPLSGDKNGMYEIVAGMRRYETALKVGTKKLPCIIRDLNDEQAYFETLRENIHREDVNPADLADSIRRGRSEMSLTTDKIAERLNMEKSEIEMWSRIADAPDVMA
jgi:ParB family chromosome partitioning protein